MAKSKKGNGKKNKDNYVVAMGKFIWNKVFKSKWFPLIASLIITTLIFAYTQFEIAYGSENKWIDVINRASIALIAGGGFSAFMKLFQYAGIFKTELEKIILDEDIHIEKSRKERDNFFINNLDVYSRSFIYKSFKELIKRFFPDNFGKIFGDDYIEDITNKVSSELRISRKSNYVQKNVVLKFTISEISEKKILLRQEFSADLFKVKGPIHIDNSFVNWSNDKKPLDLELIDIESFKLDGVEHKQKFVYLDDNGVEEKEYGHIKTSKGIKLDYDKKDKVKLSSKMNFVLSTDSFMYWNYSFGAYTKGVNLVVNYDKERFLTNVMEFTTNKDKLKGINDKYNEKSIYMPQDSLMLVIHKKQ